MDEVIYSTVFGSSGEVLRQISKLYFPAEAAIADVTYRKGSFWNAVDPSLEVIGSDIEMQPARRGRRLTLLADLVTLPYRNECFDCLVLDPPFGNGSTAPRTDCISDAYALPGARGDEAIRTLYYKGISEARRVLKKNGILVVKCQDQVNSGKRRWDSIEIFLYATRHGFEAVDKLSQVPPIKPRLRHPGQKQKHSRAWGSSYWVFRKYGHADDQPS